MLIVAHTAAFLGSLAVAAILAAPQFASAGQAAAKPTIWDGVYSTAQADRGRTVFRRVCAYCHKIDLAGGSESGAPALAGRSFLLTWSNEALATLFATIAQTMPKDGGDSGGDPAVKLTLEEYLDLVAYIVSANGAPSGISDLPADERLEQILITPKPSGR